MRRTPLSIATTALMGVLFVSGSATAVTVAFATADDPAPAAQRAGGACSQEEANLARDESELRSAKAEFRSASAQRRAAETKAERRAAKTRVKAAKARKRAARVSVTRSQEELDRCRASASATATATTSQSTSSSASPTATATATTTVTSTATATTTATSTVTATPTATSTVTATTTATTTATATATTTPTTPPQCLVLPFLCTGQPPAPPTIPFDPTALQDVVAGALEALNPSPEPTNPAPTTTAPTSPAPSTTAPTSAAPSSDAPDEAPGPLAPITDPLSSGLELIPVIGAPLAETITTLTEAVPNPDGLPDPDTLPDLPGGTPTCGGEDQDPCPPTPLDPAITGIQTIPVLGDQLAPLVQTIAQTVFGNLPEPGTPSIPENPLIGTGAAIDVENQCQNIDPALPSPCPQTPTTPVTAATAVAAAAPPTSPRSPRSPASPPPPKNSPTS